MRFVYKILLGMILLNAVMILLSAEYDGHSLFPTSGYGENAEDYDSAAGGIDFEKALDEDTITSIFLIDGGIIATVGIAGWLSKGSLNATALIGIATFLSIFASIWTITANVLAGPVMDYPIVSGLFAILQFCLWVLISFTVIEMLTGQGGMN